MTLTHTHQNNYILTMCSFSNYLFLVRLSVNERFVLHSRDYLCVCVEHFYIYSYNLIKFAIIASVSCLNLYNSLYVSCYHGNWLIVHLTDFPFYLVNIFIAVGIQINLKCIFLDIFPSFRFYCDCCSCWDENLPSQQHSLHYIFCDLRMYELHANCRKPLPLQIRPC